MEHLAEDKIKTWPTLPENQRYRNVILIVGKTGCGKSYFLKNLLHNENRVILMDCLGEYEKFQSFVSRYDLINYCLTHKIFRVSSQEFEDFPNLCHLAMGLTHCVLAIEEAQRFFPAKSFLNEYFSEIVYRGRHRAVSIIMVAQRPSSLHITPRSQWTKIISFQQTDKHDTDWLRQTSGYNLINLEKLNVGEYYEITPHTEILRKSLT
jgi:DNA helicase HerA-like ATPase